MAAAILSTSLYLLALINPPSKVFLLASIEPALTRKQLWQITLRASITGLAILLALAVVGRFLFTVVFQVELYSLQIAGGIVLFIIGLTAIQKGVFFARHSANNKSDISIVPLAAPMIAGPGTITAVISFSTQDSFAVTAAALILAVAVNFIIMLLSLWINKILGKFHAIGPLIRITGLIVAGVAVQMVLTGLGEWVSIVFSQLGPNVHSHLGDL